MSEQKLARMMMEMFDEFGGSDEFDDLLGDAGFEPDEDVEVQSYREAGVLTMNAGFVLRVGDSEFQVTIVRSR